MFGQKFEKKYNNELVKGAVSKETRFEYAWCLIRSKYSEDIKKGIVLLEGPLLVIVDPCAEMNLKIPVSVLLPSLETKENQKTLFSSKKVMLI